jgi:hypothetical protein
MPPNNTFAVSEDGSGILTELLGAYSMLSDKNRFAFALLIPFTPSLHRVGGLAAPAVW